jgi:hypothetical protein
MNEIGIFADGIPLNLRALFIDNKLYSNSLGEYLDYKNLSKIPVLLPSFFLTYRY